MPISDEALRQVYVHPGESHLVTGPAVMRTLLGSCVAILFRVPRLGIAAFCHPMLPAYPASGPATRSIVLGRRYVDFAIRDLAQQFDSLGVRRREIEVKLFGGGDVLVVTTPEARPTVGKLNYEAAIRVLHDEGFDVAASSLGGTCGLTIQFDTTTGEVLLKRLSIAGTPRVDQQNAGRQTRCAEFMEKD
jgi:chemotaxis protein CheD